MALPADAGERVDHAVDAVDLADEVRRLVVAGGRRRAHLRAAAAAARRSPPASTVSRPLSLPFRGYSRARERAAVIMAQSSSWAAQTKIENGPNLVSSA